MKGIIKVKDNDFIEKVLNNVKQRVKKLLRGLKTS